MKRLFRKKNNQMEDNSSSEELVFTKHKIDPAELETEVSKAPFKESKTSHRRLSEEEVHQDLMDIYSNDGDLPDFKTIKIHTIIA